LPLVEPVELPDEPIPEVELRELLASDALPGARSPLQPLTASKAAAIIA
jgi:hypothetical protein